MRWFVIIYVGAFITTGDVTDEEACRFYATQKPDGRWPLRVELPDGRIVYPDRVECAWEEPIS